jgi:hypothetical protein
MLGGAAAGGLVAAAAAELAVTGADWAVDDGTVDDGTVDDGTVDDGTEPGLDDPHPATAMSAMSAATVTGKRLFMSLGRRIPPPGCDSRPVIKSRPGLD